MADQMARPEKIYDYQMQIINRRWQYFATYLFLVGLIANAIPKEIWDPSKSIDVVISKKILVIISLSGVILGIVFTQLISKATERIDKLEIFIGRANTITNLPLEGKFLGLFSETVVLYFAIYFFTFLWLSLSFNQSIIVFIINAIMLLFNLFSLKWKSLKHPTDDTE
jgi:uncharacterized membrane protein